MPTKPGPITIRATDTLYTTGPLPGTATKIDPGGDPDYVEGHKVDSPLGTFLVLAQHENFYNNRNDTAIDWMLAGSFTNSVDAHIVETDSAGTSAISAVILGNTASHAYSLRVLENTGSSASVARFDGSAAKVGSIFETLSGEYPAVLVRAIGVTDFDGTTPLIQVDIDSDGPTGISVNAAGSGTDPVITPCYYGTNTGPLGAVFSADAGPGYENFEAEGGAAFFGRQGVPDGNTSGGLAGLFSGNQIGFGGIVRMIQQNGASDGTVLNVENIGRGYGILAETRGVLAACKLFSQNTGANQSAPLVLAPQTFNPSGTGIENGAVWIYKTSHSLGQGDLQNHPRFQANQAPMWLSWTDGPTCSIDSHLYTIVAGGSDDSYFTVISAAFPEKRIPSVAGYVLITFKGRVHRTQNTSTIAMKSGALFRLLDVTGSGGGPIVISDGTNVPFDLVQYVASDSANTIDSWVEFTTEYLLPAAGARTFRVEAARNPSGASGSISVTNPSLVVRPRPSSAS